MPVLDQIKSERIDIRATATAKRILNAAAAASHKNLSDFLLESGLVAAEQALADRRVFALDERDWKAFQAALDRPIKAKSRLKKLLTRPDVLG